MMEIPTTASVPARRQHALARFLHKYTLWLLLGVIALAVLTRWPVIKGMWYAQTRAVMPRDGIAWRISYTGALAESARMGKPVLLDFSATWCPPCQAMRHDVWPDARVREALTRSYIPVALDVDQPNARGPAARYQVDTIPRVLIVDSNGRVLGDAGYMSADEMLDFLKRPTAQQP